MSIPHFDSNNVKHALRQRGYTLTSWAAENGYRFRDVSDVVRGQRLGYYGKGREIAEKLAAFVSQKAA
jgi:gp16 family phage-associated protein